MAWRSPRTSPARATTSKSTPSCSSVEAVSRTCPAYATTSCAAPSTPRAPSVPRRPTRSTATASAPSTASSAPRPKTMPRRREVPKRRIIPDPKFKDKLVTKFTNTLMLCGKKSTAEGILYGALDVIRDRFKEEPLEIFRKALDNVKPKLEVKSRRVGGATYQVPVEVRPERRVTLAMRWLVLYSRDRGEKTMRERLAAEFVDAANGRGNAVKKKDDTHKMAEANKAFAHYRW